MDFSPSPRAADLTERVRAFMAAEIDPVEAQYHRDLAALRESGDRSGRRVRKARKARRATQARPS